MTIRNNEAHRAIAILALPDSVPPFMDRARVILKSMTGNAYILVPMPSVATVQQAIDELQVAQVAARMLTTGAASLRNAKKARVVTLLEEWCTQVQSKADVDAENAASIIESSGMKLRRIPPLPQRVFHAKQGPVSGSVKIVAPTAADRASYYWQYSVDSGKTWIGLSSTLRSTTSLSGLTPLTTVLFRYHSVTKMGVGDWSQPTSLLVL